jgi:hypothetical protein
MRDFGTKVDNTAPGASGILTADEDNVRFRELESAVSTSGLALDPAVGPDTNLTMLSQALARYASGGVWYQDNGSANALQLTTPLTFVMPTSYFKGMHVRCIAGYSNTGPTTVTVNGTGSKKVVDAAGNALVANLIVAGFPIELDYNPALDGGAGAFVLTPWSSILSNLRNLTGTGAVGIYKGRNGVFHELRPLLGVNGVAVALNGDVIEIDGSGLGGSGSGEVNYGSNVGGGTFEIYRDKSGAILNFKTIEQGDGIEITEAGDILTISALNAGGSVSAGKVTYGYIGFGQYFIVPVGTTSIRMKCWGAGGGGGLTLTNSAIGGPGGFTDAIFPVGGTSPIQVGQSLQIVVGEAGGKQGVYGGNMTRQYGFGGAESSYEQGGGGLSGVFTAGATISSTDSARALAIAGGGGGAAETGDPGVYGSRWGGPGNGPFSGGSSLGMQGVDSAANAAYGGGGGGYVGGNTHMRGAGAAAQAGGEGGSGYVHPAASVATISASSDAVLTPPGTGDVDYSSAAGQGGASTIAAGNHGLVVIEWST